MNESFFFPASDLVCTFISACDGVPLFHGVKETAFELLHVWRVRIVKGVKAVGNGGGSRFRKPHIVCFFFSSRPHINRFLFCQNIDTTFFRNDEGVIGNILSEGSKSFHLFSKKGRMLLSKS